MKKTLILISILITQLYCLTAQNKIKTSKNKSIKNENKLTKELVLKQLDIKQAVAMAYKNRPSLKAYKQATQASRYTEKNKLAGYFPQVTLSHQESFSKGSKGLQTSTSLEASQLVYSFAGPLEQYKIAKKDTEYAKYTEEAHKDAIRYEVEAAFLEAWLLQKEKIYIKLLEKYSNSTIKKSDNQKKLDLLGKNDWLKDASTFATNIAEVNYYSDNLANAQNNLEYLMGKSFNTNPPKLLWNYKKEIRIKSLSYYYDIALKNRKELKQKQKEIEKYQEYQKYYKKTYLPSISLSGNTGHSSGSSGSNSIGATLNWNLFDGAANFQNQNIANANKLKALMENESYIQQIKYEVQKAYHELSQYLKQLVAKNIELHQAKNEFSLNKLQLKIGSISKVDFDESEYNFQKIKNDWLTLKVNATIKNSELFYACGYPEQLKQF